MSLQHIFLRETFLTGLLRSQAIEKALREHCSIPARHFYLAAVLDDGSQTTFTGPGRYSHHVLNQIFNWNAFHREIRRSDSGKFSARLLWATSLTGDQGSPRPMTLIRSLVVTSTVNN